MRSSALYETYYHYESRAERPFCRLISHLNDPLRLTYSGDSLRTSDCPVTLQRDNTFHPDCAQSGKYLNGNEEKTLKGKRVLGWAKTQYGQGEVISLGSGPDKILNRGDDFRAEVRRRLASATFQKFF